MPLEAIKSKESGLREEALEGNSELSRGNSEF